MNTMDAKSIFASKTMWFSVVVAVLGVIEKTAGDGNVDPNVLLIVGAAGAILRMITKSGVFIK
jgi:hypothetical protein